MAKLKVLFVGSNPAEAPKTILPFFGDTKSDTILNKWINHIPSSFDISVCNVMDKKTPSNKALSKSEIEKCLPDLDNKTKGFNKIVALGKTAATALTLLGVDFYEMPHPSGLNRLLNDKDFVEEKIKGMLTYVSTPSSTADP